MNEEIVPPANQTSGDPAFDAALAEVGAETPLETPPAEVSAETPPPAEVDPDFTFATLENGQREMRLATGEIYRGKDDAEIAQKMAAGRMEASRHVQTLNSKIKELTAPAIPNPASSVTPEAIDPTALAIADLMAPAFGVKNGAELVAAFAEQQRIANAQQEFMGAQQANMEAANFFRAVPEFSKSQADADKIDQFLQANQLPFNANTAEMAYHTLKAKGEMTAAPVTTRATAPKNGMPLPPTGTAPANTGKGATTEADLWNMTADQLSEFLESASPSA